MLNLDESSSTAATLVRIFFFSPNSDFLPKTGQKTVRILSKSQNSE